jgi:hypothetical protein
MVEGIYNQLWGAGPSVQRYGLGGGGFLHARKILFVGVYVSRMWEQAPTYKTHTDTLNLVLGWSF